MNRQTVLQTLRQAADSLQSAGLTHLRLFGSVARDEANPASDIDLLADFDTSRPLTLVMIGSLESRLTDLLGAQVDLASAEWMKEPVRERALQEAIDVF